MKYVLLLSILFTLNISYAESVSSCKDLMDAYKKIGFSGSILIQNKGRSDCKISTTTNSSQAFLIGSVTKQFTSAAILLLHQQRLLSITDTIAKYFPNFPGGNQIQIHHLLSHTSGIGEVTNTSKFALLRSMPFNGLTPLIQEIEKLPSEFAPGSRWAYSNSNYLLLAEIVSKVSGKTWDEFVKSEILKSLHLNETAFAIGKTNDLIEGYQFDRDYSLIPLKPEDYYERGWANGAGGLASTTDDLAKWNRALFGGKLLNPELVSQMSSAQAVVDSNMTYGFGLFQRSNILGQRVVFHSGGIPGFTSMNIYLPEKDLSVVVLSNSFDGVTTTKIAWSLLKVALGEKAALPTNNEISLPSYQLKEKEGVFEFTDLGFKMRIHFENSAIYASLNDEPDYKLIPLSRYNFLHRAFNLQITFSSDLHSVSAIIDGTSHIGHRVP